MGMKIGQGSARDKYERFYTYYSQDELVDHLVKAEFVVENVALGEAMGMAGELEPWIALTSIA